MKRNAISIAFIKVQKVILTVQKKFILIGAIAFVLIALIVTTILIKQQQDNRQRASGNDTTTPSLSSTVTPTGTNLDSEEWKFLDIINQHRQSLNLTPLKVSKTLTDAAKWKSEDSASTNTLNHVDSQGRNINQRLPAFGYNNLPIGENIAMVFATAQSAFDVFYNACDGVFTIHQPELMGILYYGKNQYKTENLVHLQVLKMRFGNVGSVWLQNNLEKGVFINYPSEMLKSKGEDI